jgi:hypothetical protein
MDGGGFAGERMVEGKDDNKGILKEELGLQGAVVGRFEWAGKGDIDLACGQRLHLNRSMHLIERKFNVGVKFAVVADQAREEIACAPEKKSNGKGTDLAAKRSLSNFDGAVGGEKGSTGLEQEDVSLRGETGMASGSVEKSAANLAFEIGKLLADCGLGDMKAASSFGEGAIVGDCTEVAKMTEFHEALLNGPWRTL